MLALTGSAANKAKSSKGIGYQVPSGMKDITDYTIQWPTKKDPRYRDTSWLKSETDQISVYQLSETTRLAIRKMERDEPTRPYAKSGQVINHLARSGTGALAHYISNSKNKSWQYMADHLASACASSPQALLDGHASTLIHTLWGSLAAARADEKEFRTYMDYIKWWFIMAETHNGGFIVMPGRDYASTDHVYGNRNFPTATAALILSVKNRRLQITGAGSPDGPVVGSSGGTGGRGGSSASSSGAATSPLLQAVQTDGFKVVHCTREAKALSSNRQLGQVLGMLDAATKQEDERGKEAAVFAQKLRQWVTKQSAAVLKASEAQPAKSLVDLQSYYKTVQGIDESQAVRVRLSELMKSKDVRMLVAIYKQHALIVKQEKALGKTRLIEARKQRLVAALEKFVAKPGVDDVILDEAKQLLGEVQ